MVKRPTPEQLKELDTLVKGNRYSTFIPDTAPLPDRFKRDLCSEIVKYTLKNKLKQKELAKMLGIDEARASEVLHYKIHKFSADKLISMVEALYPKVSIKIK